MKKTLLTLMLLGTISLTNLQKDQLLKPTTQAYPIEKTEQTSCNLNDKYLSEQKVVDYISQFYKNNKEMSKELIRKMVKQESDYNIFAHNKRSGARGLLQLMPATWNELNENQNKDIFNPKHNIENGIKYINWIEFALSKKHPEWSELSSAKKREQILASYNWGYGHLRDSEWDISKAPNETKAYISTILGETRYN